MSENRSRSARGWRNRDPDWISDSTPTYRSFKYQLKEASEEAQSLPDFLWQVLKILAGTTWITLILLIMFTITILMSYFGIKNLDECPMRKEIPLYNLIGGTTGFLMVGTFFLKHRRMRKGDDGTDDELEVGPSVATDTRRSAANNMMSYNSQSIAIVEWLITLFMIIWFIIGNYWVFSIYWPPFRQPMKSLTPGLWCNKTFYCLLRPNPFD
uniref:Uncharacterized protein n=1 Tax=Romanomermis culicivorax TaxID=13658 RepID=A0A915L441_ROMCU